MTQRFEMLQRADSASAPALTPERNETPLTEGPIGLRPSWGARQGGPRPPIPASITPEQKFEAHIHLPTPDHNPDELAETRRWAKMTLDTYSARSNFFPDGLFADPAWDMLLDLMHARLNNKQISVSSLCIAARVPATTALRRIGDLVQTGLALRVKDKSDGRRVFVELTPDGIARMERYLTLVRTTMQKNILEIRR